jgi:hypothetical protein
MHFGHIEPRRLFTLAIKDSSPDPTEAQHIRDCSLCSDRYRDFVRYSKVANGKTTPGRARNPDGGSIEDHLPLKSIKASRRVN